MEEAPSILYIMTTSDDLSDSRYFQRLSGKPLEITSTSYERYKPSAFTVVGNPSCCVYLHLISLR